VSRTAVGHAGGASVVRHDRIIRSRIVVEGRVASAVAKPKDRSAIIDDDRVARGSRIEKAGAAAVDVAGGAAIVEQECGGPSGCAIGKDELTAECDRLVARIGDKGLGDRGLIGNARTANNEGK
jgi:hypothetical protein